MTREFSAIVTRDGGLFVAQCLDVDVASQGASEDEALSNLQEAIELYFESPRATAAPQVRKVRAEIDAA
jgi:predicted RNase H-like HicB family nuclease